MKADDQRLCSRVYRYRRIKVRAIKGVYHHERNELVTISMRFSSKACNQRNTSRVGAHENDPREFETDDSRYVHAIRNVKGLIGAGRRYMIGPDWFALTVKFGGYDANHGRRSSTKLSRHPVASMLGVWLM